MPASIWYHYYIKFLFENSVTGVTLSRCSKVPKIYMKKPHSVSIEVRSQNARKEEESSPRCIKTRCTHNTSSLARRFSKIDKSRPNDCIKCCMTVLFFCVALDLLLQWVLQKNVLKIEFLNSHGGPLFNDDYLNLWENK